MASPWLPSRYTREAHSFAQCRDAIEPNTRRFDEFFRGIEFALVTNAEQVSWEVSNTELRVMVTGTDWGFPDIPGLWIYFRIVEDGTCCELVWMELGSADGEEEA